MICHKCLNIADFSPCTLFSKTIQSNMLLPAPRGHHCSLGLSQTTERGTSREPQPPLSVHLICLRQQRYQGKKITQRSCAASLLGTLPAQRAHPDKERNCSL